LVPGQTGSPIAPPSRLIHHFVGGEAAEASFLSLFFFLHFFVMTTLGLSESDSFVFRLLFENALNEYEAQTGISLVGHPFTAILDNCDSVESITAALENQAQAFHRFRGEDGKVMKFLKGVVLVLHSLSTSGVLGCAIGIVCKKSFNSHTLRSTTLFRSRSPLQMRYSLALASFSQ